MRFATAVLALTALMVIAGCVPPQAWGHTDALRIETFALDNGLQVITLPMPKLPKVTYMVWYKVGAADDPVGKSGLAHLVEHATFRGVGAHAEQDAARSGAHRSTSEADAFTSYDYTAYYHVVPIKRLASVMYTEADRMAKLVVTHETLLPEQDEVLAERRAETTNVSEARFDEHMRAALYAKHPYGVPVLGWPDEVQRLTAPEVNTFYHTWYSPNNAILVVAGDITAARLAPLVQRYYGNIPARPVPAKGRPTAPGSDGGRRLVMQDPHVRIPLWTRMYLAPSYNAGATEHVYALQVLREILAGELAGRLHRHLFVVEKRLATAVGVDYLPDSLDVTDFTVHAMPAPGVEVTALEKAIARELEAVVAKGVSRTAVLRAQRRMQRQVPGVHEHGHAGAETLGAALATGRTLAEVGQWRERIAAVTQEQVHAAARAVLREERSVTGLLQPASASDAVRAQGVQIEQRGGAERVHATCAEREHASRRTGRGGHFHP